jgi:hypothetical protein
VQTVAACVIQWFDYKVQLMLLLRARSHSWLDFIDRGRRITPIYASLIFATNVVIAAAMSHLLLTDQLKYRRYVDWRLRSVSWR